MTLNGERQNVRRNIHESPLARLKAQRSKDGRPWLSDAAFNAGERLRQDFTHAQLMPSVTSNWNAALGGGQRRDGQGGKVELSESALDARQRFNQALSCVGPDLSDVLIDVCCHLKGLQQVEREQGWPPRSAKLMLRTGLGLLAQFYGTEPGVAARRGGVCVDGSGKLGAGATNPEGRNGRREPFADNSSPGKNVSFPWTQLTDALGYIYRGLQVTCPFFPACIEMLECKREWNQPATITIRLGWETEVGVGHPGSEGRRTFANPY